MKAHRYAKFISAAILSATSIKSIYRYRNLIYNTLLQDLKQRYAGSAAGYVWLFIFPIFLFVFYASIYLFIFRVQPQEMSQGQYIVYIMAGIVPFISFSEALCSGTSSVANKKNVLLNTVYPSEFIPLQATLTSHITALVGLSLLMLANMFFMNQITPLYLLVPVILVAQLMFVTGVTWILSVLNLVLKDIQQILAMVTMVLLIVSPIAYTPEMAPNILKIMIWANPLSYFFQAIQDIFVWGRVTYNFYIAMGLAIAMFCVGYYFFTKLKSVFYDYI